MFFICQIDAALKIRDLIISNFWLVWYNFF